MTVAVPAGNLGGVSTNNSGGASSLNPTCLPSADGNGLPAGPPCPLTPIASRDEGEKGKR